MMLKDILFDGMTIMSGGWSLRITENLILAIKKSGVSNLSVISNNAGTEGYGLGLLLETKQIKKAISSYVGENKLFEKQYLSGEIELEFNPRGTLAKELGLEVQEFLLFLLQLVWVRWFQKIKKQRFLIIESILWKQDLLQIYQCKGVERRQSRKFNL